MTKLAARAGQAIPIRFEVVLGAGLKIVILRCGAFDGVVIFLHLPESYRKRECECQETPSRDAHRHPGGKGLLARRVDSVRRAAVPDRQSGG